MLSTVPTTPAPTATRMMPLATDPFRISQAAAGSQMIQAPIGNSEKRAITTPQKTGAPRPRSPKVRPPRPPWIPATRNPDVTVANTRSRALVSIRSRWYWSKGRARRTHAMMEPASRNRKNTANSMNPRLKKNNATPLRMVDNSEAR
jgi:hypothetical protein